MKGKNGRPKRRKTDPFVERKQTFIDYKDVATLRRFLSDQGKILPRRVTGVNAGNQRKLAAAIARARAIALLPFSER
jgi:small subunit ribosomal protein S18